MGKFINFIVDEDQVGYIKGRSISCNLRLIDDVIEYLRNKNKPGVLLALDFTKAFDSISKRFMLSAFRRFGFGEQFVKWISVLMANTKSRISYNGWMSESFDVKCGVRQGCPFSPLAFILAIELLAIRFRSSNEIKGIGIECVDNSEIIEKIVKAVLYADDVTMFLKDREDIQVVLFILEMFKEISGLTINRTKSEAMWLGSNRNNELTGFDFKWVKEIKILGVYFCNNCSASSVKNNWEDRIKAVKIIILSWEKRNLSMLGKICVIKSFLASQFIYVMKAICFPEKILSVINSLFFRFLWRRKDCNRRAFEKVKRSVMINDFSKGGVNMVDVKFMQQSFQCEWLQRLSQASNKCKWSWIPSNQFSAFGRNYAFLNSTVGCKKFKGLDKVTSLFWKNALSVWLCNNQKDHSILFKNQCLWNNKLIKHQGNVLYFEDWAKNGITYVNDILNGKTILTYRQTVTKLQPSAALFLQYKVVYSAVTAYLKQQLIQDNNNNVSEEETLICFNSEKFMHAKQYRLYLTENVYSSPCCERFWRNKFEVTITEGHWNIARNTTSESRLRELQWKLLHNIYPTSIMLFKMGRAISDKCPYCPGLTDYIEHFFFDCNKIKPVWNCVSEFFYAKYNKNIILSRNEALLGILEYNNLSISMIQSLNHLILIAKMSISKYRYGTPILIQTIFKRETSLRNLDI